MMTSIRRAALAALVLALAFRGALLAAGEGRIIATITDDKGAPVEGAKVTLTRTGTAYKIEKVRDKKGQVMLLVLDATQEYQLHIEKAGYGPYDGPVKPKVSDTMRLSFTLPAVAPRAAASEGPKELSGADQAVLAYNEGAEKARTGNLEDAAVFFEKVVQIAPADPKFAKAHYVLGLTYAKDDAKKAQAKEQLNAFLQLAPNDPDAATAKEMLAYLK